MQAFTQHEADVLSIAVDTQDNCVYASGVDNRVVQLRLTQTGKKVYPPSLVSLSLFHTHSLLSFLRPPPPPPPPPSPLPYTRNRYEGMHIGVRRNTSLGYKGSLSAIKSVTNPSVPQMEWVLSGRCREHTHDVRALALGPTNELVTGGVDCNLIVYSTTTFGALGASHRKIPPFPHRRIVHVAQARQWIMYQHSRKLQLWRLGSSELSLFVCNLRACMSAFFFFTCSPLYL